MQKFYHDHMISLAVLKNTEYESLGGKMVKKSLENMDKILCVFR